MDTAETARVDVVLSRGLALSGVVISDGARQRGARVSASSGVAGAEWQSAETGDGGRFTIAGLVAGRYDLSASFEDRKTTLKDVSAGSSVPLRLVLERLPSAVLTGRVVGPPASDDALMRIVYVTGDDGRDAQAAILAGGAFRVEGAPAGPVTVRAVVTSASGANRWSRSRSLVLAAGSETETEIEFGPGITIAGTVTRQGTPLALARVSFANGNDPQDHSQARTDAAGRTRSCCRTPAATGSA